MNTNNVAIILTGGGARGAYQAGVLKAINSMCDSWGVNNPFNIVVGNSAGAINAAFYASGIHKPAETANELAALWSEIKTDNIFQIGSFYLGKTVIRFLFELTTGNLFVRRKSVRALLDTTPLYELIEKHLNFSQIETNIQNGYLRGLAIKAANYSTGYSETFVHGISDIEQWKRYGRMSKKEVITIDHIMASTAIPIVFPPVKIGNYYYGDGSLRSYTPFSSAIKMGANKIIVVGASQSMTDRISQSKVARPSVGRIFSLILNSVLFDAVDLDIERLNSMNAYLETQTSNHSNMYKKINHCLIRPTKNLGLLATKHIDAMPKTIRHLLKGLGTKRESSDLISYLLFEGEFTQKLVELGIEDAYKKEEELRRFFLED